MQARAHITKHFVTNQVAYLHDGKSQERKHTLLQQCERAADLVMSRCKFRASSWERGLCVGDRMEEPSVPGYCCSGKKSMLTRRGEQKVDLDVILPLNHTLKMDCDSIFLGGKSIRRKNKWQTVTAGDKI